jgi:hypothetical protein
MLPEGSDLTKGYLQRGNAVALFPGKLEEAQSDATALGVTDTVMKGDFGASDSHRRVDISQAVPAYMIREALRNQSGCPRRYLAELFPAATHTAGESFKPAKW